MRVWSGKRLILAMAMLLLLCCMPSFAGWKSVTVTPTKATVNSIYEIAAVWEPEPNVVATEIYLIVDDTPIVGPPPDDYDPTAPPNPANPDPRQHTPYGGASFRVTMSAGLNLKDERQGPRFCNLNPKQDDPWSDANNPLFYRCPYPGPGHLTYPNGYPILYVPYLTEGDHTIGARAVVYNDKGETRTIESVVGVKICGSAYNPGYPDTVDYNGMGNSDRLLAYPDADFPYMMAPDPLNTTRPSSTVPTDESTPDEGASSDNFVFQVRYHNMDDLPPQPWFNYWADEFDPYMGRPQLISDPERGPTGVVLFLDLVDPLDLAPAHRNRSYRPHFMRKVTPLANNYKYGGVDYRYTVTPVDEWVMLADGAVTFDEPIPYKSNDYIALMTGNYHYFFSCTDDVLYWSRTTADNLTYRTFLGSNQMNAEDWGEYGMDDREWTRSSTMLDPFMPRNLVDKLGNPYLPRELGRTYSQFGIMSDYDEPKDWTALVDRVNLVPGRFELDTYPMSYQFPATEYPVVTSELAPFSKTIQDGSGRFMGTIEPFYRAVNPLIDVTAEQVLPRGGFGYVGARSESTGATAATTITFRVRYKGITNDRSPDWIKVFISNTSNRLIDGTTPEAGGYVGFTMKPCERQSDPYQSQTPPYKYHDGYVDYEYKTQLPPGPHTYYFMAFDNQHYSLYPARPNFINFKDDDNTDYWLPAPLDTETTMPANYDNNVFPGPYINHAALLSQATVSPTTGLQGDDYKFRVFYQDPDGQRPYSAYVYIDTGNPAIGDSGVIKGTMNAEPSTTPYDYKKGVWYKFDTATLEDFSMALGVRHYRFEFTDDWGRLVDRNDRVKGETSKYPVNGAWVDGPVIAENARPRLTNGSAKSADGTSNTASIWTFKVTYTDTERPKYVTVYIGKLSTDGTKIVWDAGHEMSKSDSTDNLYTDGVEYGFQTRLEGAQNPGDPDPSYYYAFETSDGVNLATWVPVDSPDADLRSESAGCMLKEDLQLVSGRAYSVGHSPIVGTLGKSPIGSEVLMDPIVWMYPDGDFNNPQIVPKADTYVVQGYSSDPLTAARYIDVDEAYLPVITDVVGVYTNAQLTGIDYFQSEDGVTTGSYDIVTGIVNLARPLPFGTSWVWIKYRNDHPAVVLGSVEIGTMGGATFSATTSVVRTSKADAPMVAVTGAHAIGSVDLTVSMTLTAADGLETTGTCTIPAESPVGTRIPVTVADGKNVVAVTDCTVTGGSAEDSFAIYIPGDVYEVERLTGTFTFSREQVPTDVLKADYFFASPVNSPIGANVMPILTDGKLSPMVGSSGTDFVYSVVYRETEGFNGQAPSFINVVINGTARPMTSTVTGVPSFRAGVTYTYTTKLPSGKYDYYFEASDGAGMVTFPLANIVTGKIYPSLGPWVNDPPTLSNGLANPNPVNGSISTLQPVTYTVLFTDTDNEEPISYKPFAADTTVTDAVRDLTISTPLLYVDNPNEEWTICSVADIVADPAQPTKRRIVQVTDATGATPNYLANQYAGKLLQILTGPLAGTVYTIVDNTNDSVKLLADDLVDEGLATGTLFSISTLQMTKLDISQRSYTNGVTYTLTGPALGLGSHKFHFKAASVMTPPSWIGAPYDTMTQSAWVKFPAAGDLDGPTVTAVPPVTNRTPVLSMQNGDVAISPTSGTTADSYDFVISYKDDDGDAPHLHDGNIMGYIRVVFNDGSYSANLGCVDVEEGTDFYKTIRKFTATANGLPGGKHRFHFEASDGWTVTRWPALGRGQDPTAGDPVVSVNSKAVLSSLLVAPPSGNTGTTFDVSVKYSDNDELAPWVEDEVEKVWVEFDGPENSINLSRSGLSMNWKTGVTYTGKKAGLPAGTYTVVFKAMDNAGEVTSVTYPTPLVVAQNLNTPELSDAVVFNISTPTEVNDDAKGSKTDRYRYKVTYIDADGNIPVVEQGGLIVEGIQLYVDGRLEAVLGPAQRTGSDFSEGVTYQYDKVGTSFTGGAHTYYFVAKDDMTDPDHTVRTEEINGPSVLSASISLIRETYDAASSTWVERDPKVGEQLRVRGALVASPTMPIDGGRTLNISVTQPDGKIKTSTVTANETNEFVIEETPLINRNWTFTVKWNGNADYVSATTQDLKVNVNGPTRLMATQNASNPLSAPAVDMVCMPMVSPTFDVGSLFGYDRASLIQIAKWDPVQGQYLVYGKNFFPSIQAGSAVWIYPKTAYPLESIDTNYMPFPVDLGASIDTSSQYRLLKPFGTVQDQTAPCSIILKTGWNQVGSPFFSLIDTRNIKVSNNGTTVSLDQAYENGWVRNYFWMWHPTSQEYKLIHTNRADAYSRTLEPWRGYWIKALKDCTIILPAPTSASSRASLQSEELTGPVTHSVSKTELDAPPSAPVRGGIK